MKNIYAKGIMLVALVVFSGSGLYAQQRGHGHAGAGGGAGARGRAGTRRHALARGHGVTQWRKNIDYLSKQHFGKAVAARKTAARATTELAERLVGESVYDYNIMDSLIYGTAIGLADSTVFQYSGSRSSTFDYNQMFFDPTFYYGGQVIMGFGGTLGTRDAANAPAILFDSCWTYSNGFSYIYFTDTFAVSDVQYALYDTNNNVTDCADLGVMDSMTSYPENRFVNSFDISDNLVSTYSLSWDMGTWDTTELTTYTYNFAGLVVQDSTYEYYGGGVWQLGEAWVYTFDDSGNMVHADYYDDSEGYWQYAMQYFMHYNSANQITWDSVTQYAGSWLPQASDTFGYTAGVDYITYECLFDLDGGTPASYLYRTKHINGAGLPDTLWQWEVQYGDSQLIDGQKYGYSYDAYSEPTMSYEYLLNLDTPTYTAGWYDTTVDYITYYYYQTYEERNANTGHAAANTKITIYPNPTTDGLNIYRPGINNGAYTYIRLTNAKGQTVRTESLPWLSERETVSMAGLVPGTYWITIQDKDGNTLLRQEVVKQ